MKVLGLISSHTDPASRIRIMQYKEPLQSHGIELDTPIFRPLRDKNPSRFSRGIHKVTGINEWRVSDFFKSFGRLSLLSAQKKYELIWQNRLLLPQHSWFEKRWRRPLVFDFDDAIWLNEGEKQVANAIRRSAMVFAGNPWLGEFAARYNNNVHVIPSVVDTGRIFPFNQQPDRFVIGWTGTKSNFPYLDIVRQPLLDFLSKEKDSKLVIVSDQQPPQFPFDNERIVFQPWSIAEENKLINSFSVGLMPIHDTDWEKGKCAYKLLQYLACGKPVIASPVGLNNSILHEQVGLPATTPESWTQALEAFKSDPAYALECGNKGRRLVEEKYSLSKYAPLVSGLFQQIVAR
jgi:glycosyltransferase involved in cell wall biosynthesis